MKFKHVDGTPSESNLQVSRLKSHDVITIIPPYKTKKRLKLFEKIPLWIILDDICNSECWVADAIKEDTGLHTFQVIKIDYEKYPWWQFWNKNKYVKKYYLEVL